ncbi:MAG: hypothetical protein ACI93L_000673 [Cyclobacteriaceae bacterium]|jgi:hypothetical protein
MTIKKINIANSEILARKLVKLFKRLRIKYFEKTDFAEGKPIKEVLLNLT